MEGRGLDGVVRTGSSGEMRVAQRGAGCAAAVTGATFNKWDSIGNTDETVALVRVARAEMCRALQNKCTNHAAATAACGTRIC